MISRNKLLSVALSGLSLGALVGNAQAEESKFGYSWTVTGASDYIFRGISYTKSDPTVNSYLELTYNTGGVLGTAYVGFWTSNIDIAGGAGPWEQDFYVGIRPTTGPISWDLSTLYYTYGGQDGVKGSDLDYVEFKAMGTYSPVTNLALTGAFYYTPNQDVAATENISIEGGAAYTLSPFGKFTPTISGLVGYSNSDDNAFYNSSFGGGYWNGDQEYVYWNAGLKLTVEKFSMDLRYWDTTVDTTAVKDRLSDERFLFTVSVAMP